MRVVVHASSGVPWQRERAPLVERGLRERGIACEVTQERQRLDDGLAILLGTTFWRSVERSGPFVLIDRCSFGDTNMWVSLVRDGHGRRGDHAVPVGAPPSRWEWMQRIADVRVEPWRTGGKRVLCGQTETYSPRYASLAEWYRSVPATHFRQHPAGDNPTGLPAYRSWVDVGQAITLNSSVAVEAIFAGVPTVTMDEGAMAWDVASHSADELAKPDRLPWLHWLAWTQWHWDEIAQGKPWERFF